MSNITETPGPTPVRSKRRKLAMNQPGTVLVVEDNESERSLYAQLLRKHGFNVQTAENADKAIG